MAGMIYCAVITWQAYGMIASSISYGKVTATLLRIPMWIPQLALLLGFGLLTLQFAIIIIDRFQSVFSGGEEAGSC